MYAAVMTFVKLDHTTFIFFVSFRRVYVLVQQKYAIDVKARPSVLFAPGYSQVMMPLVAIFIPGWRIKFGQSFNLTTKLKTASNRPVIYCDIGLIDRVAVKE